MNVLILLGISIICFGLAGRFYSRVIARKLGEDPDHPTPAVRFNDGRDYVPTKTYVVFAHHFSAIRGHDHHCRFPRSAVLRGPLWHSVVSLALRH
jgi:carbon starvation protein